MEKPVRKVDKILIISQKVLIIVTFSAMMILVMMQILFRYVFYIRGSWIEEMARLMLVWCIFFGGALGMRLKEHVIVDFVIRKMNPKLASVFSIIAKLCILAFACVMIVWGTQVFLTKLHDTTTMLGYPKGLFFLPCPISGFLIAIYTIADTTSDITKLFRSKKKGEIIA